MVGRRPNLPRLLILKGVFASSCLSYTLSGQKTAIRTPFLVKIFAHCGHAFLLTNIDPFTYTTSHSISQL